MRAHPKVELLRSRLLLRGGLFDVLRDWIRLPSGTQQKLLVVEHPGAVCVAPVVEGGRLLLVRQYRHPAADWLLEIPAGRMEPGETAEEAARRELEEETGHRAAHWRVLKEFMPAPGFCSERLTLFEARELEAVPGGGLACDEDEELELVHKSPREILEGGIVDAKTLIAAALLLLEA